MSRPCKKLHHADRRTRGIQRRICEKLFGVGECSVGFEAHLERRRGRVRKTEAKRALQVCRAVRMASPREDRLRNCAGADLRDFFRLRKRTKSGSSLAFAQPCNEGRSATVCEAPVIADLLFHPEFRYSLHPSPPPLLTIALVTAAERF